MHPFINSTPARYDAELLTRIGIALTLRQRPSFRSIVIEVNEGIVALRGWIPSFFDRQLAVETTRRVAGVRQVQDELQVLDDRQAFGSGHPERSAYLGSPVAVVSSLEAGSTVVI